MIESAEALFTHAKLGDFLFCSVFENGLDREWNGASVYTITTMAKGCFLLTSIATGVHLFITQQQFADRYWWLLHTPALTQGMSQVHSKIILAANNKYEAVLDAGVKNYGWRPPIIH